MKKILTVLVLIFFTGLAFFFRQKLWSEFSPSSHPAWLGFETGSTYIFKLKMKSASKFNMGRMLLPTQSNKPSHLPSNSLTIQMGEGEILVDVIKKREAGMELTLTLRNMTLAVVSPLVNAQGIENLKSELHSTFLADIDAQGKLQSIHFGKNQSVLAQNLLRQMIQQFLPVARAGELWEETPQGQSLVLFRESSSGTIDKIFQDHKVTKSAVQPTIAGGFRYDFDTSTHILKEVSGFRSLKAEKSGNLYFDDRFEMSLSFVRSERRSMGWLSAARMRLQGHVAYPDAHEQLDLLEEEINRKIVGKQKFSDLVQELMHDASRLPAAKQTDMYRKLKAHLALNPELVDVFKDLIQQFDSSDPRFDMLVTLLATQGSEASQEALVDLMDDYENDARGLRNIALHVALVDKPSSETIEYFLDKVSNLEPESPAYSLLLQLSGSVIHSNRDSAEAKKLYSFLEDQLASPAQPSLHHAAVMALGNSGNPQNWQKANVLLESDDAEARSKGLALVRLVKGELSQQVEDTFVDTIAHDSHSANRRDAAAYLSQRKVSKAALPQLKEAFLQERDQTVSMNILDAIAHQPEDPKLAVEALKEINSRCGSPEICAKAEALLLSLLSS